MSLITLRYQLAIFGNYDEITPSLDNIKFFINDFSDKGFIPSQVREVGIDIEGGLKNVEIPRLSLSNADQSWNIQFNSDRIDFRFVNVNFNVISVPTLDEFTSTAADLLIKISTKFGKKHRRIGLVTNYVFESKDLALSKKFINTVPYFLDKPNVDWASRIAIKANIAEPLAETINVTNDARWIKTPFQIDNKQVEFSGIYVKIDTNTLNENFGFRIQNDNILPLLREFEKLSEEVKAQITHTLNG